MMNYQKLFDHMFQEHGLTLTEGEMQDIIHEVNALQSKGNTKEEVLPGGDEINEAADEYGFRVPYDGSDKFYDEDAIKHFLAGVRFVEQFVEQAIANQQPEAMKEGWVKEHVKCATLCAGCNEDCKGRESYFTKPQP